MKCNDSQNYMMKFFDRELNDIEEAQLKQHLKICTACSEEFVGLKEIFAVVEQNSEIEPPEDFECQVMNRIENEVKMYKKHIGDSTFVYDILSIAVSFIFVIFFGGLLWDCLKAPTNVVHFVDLISYYSNEFFSVASSMGKGIIIAIAGVAASIYKTYYYAYIVLGILLFMSLKTFFKMVKTGGARTAMDNGGLQ